MRPARTVRLEVRATTVILSGPWRPGGWTGDCTVNLVEAREVDAPPGAAPLHWRLLTSLPCARWVEARRVLGRYAARWRVEEYHKALKTGAGVEQSQLAQAYRLETLVAVLAIVAVRLLSTKLLASTQPDAAIAPGTLGPEALAILAGPFGQPPGGWTHQSLLVAVVRLGGFLARRHDGWPGWQTIWRGWQRLLWMSQGLETLQPRAERCG